MAEAQTILITGCSSGIGYVCAHGLKERGWTVVASCRKAADVERLRGEGLDCVLIDYEDEPSIRSGFEEAMQITNGQLDAVFNNGAYATPGFTEDLPTDALRAIFETNFFGWHTLTALALKEMRKAGRGRIVQCSSILGFAAMPGRGAYNSTKFALEGLNDTLRLELRGSGIHVSLIQPGPITTKIRQNAIAHFDRWMRPTIAGSYWKDEYERKVIPRLNGPYRKSRGELGPEAVLEKLIHAIESPRPRAKYPVTWPTHLAGYLKRVLPQRAYDWMLNRLG